MPGLKRTSWSSVSFQWRLAFLVASLVAGVGLITWMKTSTWKQMRQLQLEFTAVPGDYFALEDSVQLQITEMNDMFLDYLLRHNLASRDDFRNAARTLEQLLEKRRNLPRTAGERAAFGKMEQACHHYLGVTETLLQAADGATPAGEIYQALEKETIQVQAAANDLSRAQNSAFAALLHESGHTLFRLQNLLQLSVLLLWLLAIFLAVLGYRGMIAPLRHRLSESDALLLRQEKLASLGVLAAGVAHEIRNPLTAIKFRLFSLNKTLPEINGSEDAKVIGDEINRLDRIVKDFLEFARPSEPDLVSVPGEHILRQAGELMKPLLEKSGIRFEVATEPNLWIQADSEQIEQVLINLIQNSADSIGHNGTVTLEGRADTARLNGRDTPVLILAVTDTGKGIPPEVERRLFDPFFTTKEGGTGLGLAIAARIVEKHGGLLRYRTKLNHGTTFEVVLPKSNDHAPQTPVD